MGGVPQVKSYVCFNCKIAGGVFYEGLKIECPSCKSLTTETFFAPHYQDSLPKNCPYPNGLEAGAEEQIRVGLKVMEEKGKLKKGYSRYWKKYLENGDRFNPILQKARKERAKREGDLKQRGMLIND